LGRVRLLDYRYQFTVEVQQAGPIPLISVQRVRFDCSLEDLYDFNREAGWPAYHAAGVQIGFGRGTNGNNNGRIYRDLFFIRYDYEDYPLNAVRVYPSSL